MTRDTTSYERSRFSCYVGLRSKSKTMRKKYADCEYVEDVPGRNRIRKLSLQEIRELQAAVAEAKKPRETPLRRWLRVWSPACLWVTVEPND